MESVIRAKNPHRRISKNGKIRRYHETRYARQLCSHRSIIGCMLTVDARGRCRLGRAGEHPQGDRVERTGTVLQTPGSADNALARTWRSRASAVGIWTGL